ncbi:MAG: hypothetical protein KME57_23010 [Scytonema hyalinum WJT4-NPBG1]|jgi:hypothetical protein|nr:hypothetical protein [Scytonema hyalinum WJT4-NPBG1]
MEIILTNRVSLNLLPNTYSFELDGVTYNANEYFDNLQEMLEHAVEEICLEHMRRSSDEEHEELIQALDSMLQRYTQRYDL